MAVFRAKDPEQWLPRWLRGRGIKVEKARCKNVDGTTSEYPIDPVTGTFTVEDPRSIHQLSVDTAYEQVE